MSILSFTNLSQSFKLLSEAALCNNVQLSYIFADFAEFFILSRKR